MTPEHLADPRKQAEAATVVEVSGDDMLALLTALDVANAVAEDARKERDELRAQLATHQAFDHNPIRDDVSGD